MKMSTRSVQFRQVITDFIDERREQKLKGLEGEAAAQTAAKYDYNVWLADAARRVGQIQAVTHVLKASHPDARGTSLYVVPSQLTQHREIGTHLLDDNSADDIVGNAAALDVYKFLRLEVEDRRLLDLLQADDVDLLTVLHDDPLVAREWADAFKSLIRSEESLASHTLAKQVYWCVSDEPSQDDGYHLLQPLFSSSLAHVVHREINDARFGEINKLARQARREKNAHDTTYRDYRNLAIRKLGGTKPQNISQLNSERGGVNYLLASLPPRWNHDKPRQFLLIDSALQRFRRYEGVNELIEALIAFIKNDPTPTLESRQKRERIERALGYSLAAFGLATRELFQPGWTRDGDCRLPLCEQLWLDPERVDLPVRSDHEAADTAFIQASQWNDWPDEIAHRFGNWLNAILIRHNVPVGDVEHAHWAKQAIVTSDWAAERMRDMAQEKLVAALGANHG